jgi:AraC family transcriptional activator of pyochelin receptor
MLVSGAVVFASGNRVTDPVRDGLRIIVVLDGATTLSVGDQPELTVDRPTMFAILSEGESPRDQRFFPDLTFRYVLVQIDAGLVRREIGVDARTLFKSHGSSASGGFLAIASRPADAGLQAVAGQILACPRERRHHLYRAAKALELVALSIDLLRPTDRSLHAFRLSASEVAKVEAARDALIADMNQAPDLDALASDVGLTPRRLNSAFRARFGSTPYAHLQEHRLQTAYRTLASGETTVAACAYQVGYTPAHFATLFRKRFGMPPSALTSRAAALRGKPILERA